jgi:nitrogen regulatory protein P-II 2
MDTTERILVTIVAEAVLEHRLVDDIKECGARGYSLGHVRGEGVTGNTSLDLNGPSIRLETVVTEKVSDAILDMLAERYFGRYAVIAWLTPIRVARPDRF